jgi:hypothetical protein
MKPACLVEPQHCVLTFEKTEIGFDEVHDQAMIYAFSCKMVERTKRMSTPKFWRFGVPKAKEELELSPLMDGLAGQLDCDVEKAGWTPIRSTVRQIM